MTPIPPPPPSTQLARAAVGFPTALATAVGLVMASPVMLTASSGVSLGGRLFFVAMLVAAALMALQASTFAEAATLLPTAGSVYDFIACGLGRVAAITGTLSTYLLVHTFAGTAETVLAGVMATVHFESLHALLVAHQATWVVGVALVLGFAVLNFFGIQLFARVEIVVTAAMWLTLMVFGIGALLLPPAAGAPPGLGASRIGDDPAAAFSLVGMALFMFLGLEFVTPLAPSMRAPQRWIPRAMVLGLFGVLLCTGLWALALLRQVPDRPIGDGTLRLLETPQAVPLLASAVLGAPGRVWLGLAFLLAGAATINTLMAALPRLLYGMALDGALPRAFAWLHPRYRTPVLGIVVSAAIPIVGAIAVQGEVTRIMPLVLAGVCAWSGSYLLVNLSIAMLRWRRPDLARPFRSPWFPLPQLLASAGIVAALADIAPPTMSPAAIYGPFAAVLVLSFVYALAWTVGVRRQAPFAPVPVEQVLERAGAPAAPRDTA
ncbi:APC family permease [Aquabacterium sp.]|uniref:APC family permease n=1 Tax=Aquabacterium sp. TaxID=1872578 RepID=UPI003784D719